MKKLFLLFSISLCLFSCKTGHKGIGADHKAAQYNKKNAASAAGTSPALMHLVFFKTRADLTPSEMADFQSKLLGLAKIEGVIGMRVGTPAATGDPRLHSDYQFALQMGFASETDLAAYQTNADHIQARDATKGYLAAPPVVYDYWLLGKDQ